MNRYWHVCPAFVEELRSPTARLTALREKMLEWVEHGAELAWLVDPERRVVEVYRAGREPETVSGTEFVEGEGGGDWVPVGVGAGLGAFGEEVGDHAAVKSPSPKWEAYPREKGPCIGSANLNCRT